MPLLTTIKKPYLLFALSLITLSSCANYHASSLNTLAPDAILSSHSMEKKEILIVAKAFSKRDCQRYLDRDVIAEGYQPVQLYIENRSDKSYVFALDRISLAHAEPEEVAEKVHTSTVGRAVGYGVGALFLWPLAIPAVVDGIKSHEANNALDTDFLSKAARNQVIEPHSYFNKLLFVPNNEYQPSFTLTLLDQNAQAKTFTVSAS